MATRTRTRAVRKWYGDELVAEVQWFFAAGVSPELTAQNLGMTPAAVEGGLRRAGRKDLAARFYAFMKKRVE